MMSIFYKANPDGKEERRWPRLGCVRVVDLTDGYIPKHRDGDILTSNGESHNTQVCLFSHWLKSLKPFFTPVPLVTHYRLLCPGMPGGLRPPVFTCTSDKARLCARVLQAHHSLAGQARHSQKPPPVSAQAPQFPLHSLCPLSCD